MRQNGFSLIELIVVITIPGILSMMVVSSIDHVTEDAKVSAIKADLKTLAGAASLFRGTFGRDPHSIEELVDPPEHNGGQKYFLDEAPIDHVSGGPYLHETDGRGVLFLSYGRDGLPGGEGYDADIASRKWRY